MFRPWVTSRTWWRAILKIVRRREPEDVPCALRSVLESFLVEERKLVAAVRYELHGGADQWLAARIADRASRRGGPHLDNEGTVFAARRLGEDAPALVRVEDVDTVGHLRFRCPVERTAPGGVGDGPGVEVGEVRVADVARHRDMRQGFSLLATCRGSTAPPPAGDGSPARGGQRECAHRRRWEDAQEHGS